MPRILANKKCQVTLILGLLNNRVPIRPDSFFIFFDHLWTDGVCRWAGGGSLEAVHSCALWILWSARLMNELLLAAAEVDTELEQIGSSSAVRSSPFRGAG